jgi:hypothetical protein
VFAIWRLDLLRPAGTTPRTSMAAHRRPFPVCDTFTMITCAAIGMGGGPKPQPWRPIGGSRGVRRGRARINASVRRLGSLQVGATAGCQRRSPVGRVSERLCMSG